MVKINNNNNNNEKLLKSRIAEQLNWVREETELAIIYIC